MDPEFIFSSAEQFEQTAALLSQQIGIPGSQPPITPFVVNITFSIELYLKCLIVIETKQKPKKTHQLHALFNKLSPESKKAITNDFDSMINSNKTMLAVKERMPTVKTDIDSVLLGMNQAFSEFRYISIDGKDSISGFSLIGTNHLNTAIKNRINTLLKVN